MRIYNNHGEPMDFCRHCMPDEAEAEEKYNDTDDLIYGRYALFEYNTEHPDYEEWNDYTCETCNRPLTRKDD